MRKIGAGRSGGCITVDRSAGKADVGVPLISLAQYEVPAYHPDNLPPELASFQLNKPGSRKFVDDCISCLSLKPALKTLLNHSFLLLSRV
ncbi:MAG: hypothetical protein R3D29_00890 [Nitratireductor sp.]